MTDPFTILLIFLGALVSPLLVVLAFVLAILAIGIVVLALKVVFIIAFAASLIAFGIACLPFILIGAVGQAITSIFTGK